MEERKGTETDRQTDRQTGRQTAGAAHRERGRGGGEARDRLFEAMY